MIQFPEKIKLPVFSDVRGSLSFLESSNHLSFEIKRVILLEPTSAVPLTLNLGKDIALIPLNGNIVVHTLSGETPLSHGLSNPSEVLIIPLTTSFNVDFCSSSSVLLLLSS